MRNGVVAAFHALKLKPVFVDAQGYEVVAKIIRASDAYNESHVTAQPNGEGLLKVIKALVDNRVLSEKAGFDDEVISTFRRGIRGPEVRIAYFILSESCNLACRYCFEKAPAHSADRDMMSESVALKCIDFFERMLSLNGASEDEEKSIIFYGGEPLLNYGTLLFSLREIRKRQEGDNAHWKNVQLSLVTNGTLLTEERLAELNSLGLSIGISVDGPEEITNANRHHVGGRGCFKEAKRAIDLCKSAGVEFSLSMTLSEAAVQRYSEVMEFIWDTTPKSVGFNILLGGSEGMPDEEYSRRAAEFVLSAFEEFRKRGIYEDRIMRKVRAFTRSRVYPFDCGAAGGNQVVFSPAGRVGICHGYLADKKYFPTTVDDASFKPGEDPVFLEWARRTPLMMEACQPCEAMGICGGGCPMNAERTKGALFGLDERFCVHARKTLEWLVWDLYENAKR
jgi:uncharacterized protein